MNAYPRQLALALAVLATTTISAPMASAQRGPGVGYVYPAGGQTGATLEVVVGGQFLGGVRKAIVSGGGVQATVIKHVRPLNGKEFLELQEKVQEAQKKAASVSKRPGNLQLMVALLAAAEEAGIDPDALRAFLEMRRRRADPKGQVNPQLSETVVLQVTIDPDAEPGPRELRLFAPAGLSAPWPFHIGRLPERREEEPNDRVADQARKTPLPLVLNGQILPGDADRFSFEARKGQRLVAVASARALAPYLADAVPGWFQAVLTLYDAEGREVAFADDYRYDPDPVLCYEVPKNGRYTLEIRDALYRGREDFVYRVTLGEVPFVTSVFPLGGPATATTTVKLAGWNLPSEELSIDGRAYGPGLHWIPISPDAAPGLRVPFAIDDALQESLEQEPNDEPAGAQGVRPPRVLNGRIDRPDDQDVFQFEGRAGSRVVVEVQARRLGSPLDSLVRLTDAAGRQLAAGDDCENTAAGLSTHQADSRIEQTLPSGGTYYVHLGDAQRHGGPDYGYRLRSSAPRPDFELRVVPSSVTARAGMSAPVTVHALRKDGFDGDIFLELVDAPRRFRLDGGLVPGGQERARCTLGVPAEAPAEPVALRLEGRVRIDGRDVRRPVVPADERMQAFIYRHLVPAQEFVVAVAGRRARAELTPAGDTPVRIQPGRPAAVRIAVSGGPFFKRVFPDLRWILSDPPEGIALKRASLSPDGFTLQLSADPAKVKPGLRGNLIVEVFLNQAVPGSQGKPAARRRVPVGALPAIPFEVASPPGR